MNNYYKVEVLAAHCAHYNDKDILTFYFKAKDMCDACRKARHMPGVKHDRANAVQLVEKISYEEYAQGRTVSAYEVRDNPLKRSNKNG